jgi:hypothetical protein
MYHLTLTHRIQRQEIEQQKVLIEALRCERDTIGCQRDELEQGMQVSQSVTYPHAQLASNQSYNPQLVIDYSAHL